MFSLLMGPLTVPSCKMGIQVPLLFSGPFPLLRWVQGVLRGRAQAPRAELGEPLKSRGE